MKTKSNKSTIIMVIIALAVVVGMCMYPLMTIKDSEFGGADGAAGDLILEIDKDFEPWAEPLFPLPGGETESMMFSLQAALGSGIFCFCAGYLFAAKKFKKANSRE
ncbi:energy-coupling factor ABC transporter substrate-binding protein [Oscillospiraceae bacterium PP1C4]